METRNSTVATIVFFTSTGGHFLNHRGSSMQAARLQYFSTEVAVVSWPGSLELELHNDILGSMNTLDGIIE